MSARSPLHRGLAWTLVFAYMAGIFWCSHQASVPMPESIPHLDKALHFLAYLGLAMALAHALAGGRRQRFLWAFVLAALYGISDEVHQAFVPGRDASALDWLADAAGAWTGAFVYLAGRRGGRNAQAERASSGGPTSPSP